MPNPIPNLLTAVVRLGIWAEECLVIEDSLHGIASACGAGLPHIGTDNILHTAQHWLRLGHKLCAPPMPKLRQSC